MRTLLFTKILIIFFWVLFIFGFLFFPQIKNYFFQEKNSINILAWADMIDLERISAFEEETGIKVYLSYYENNEELFAKLQVTDGKGYDLITLTDLSVDHLIKKGLLKKIDKSKLKFWNDLDPHFLNHEYDPNNLYSIPYNWDIFGMGINKKYFGEKHNIVNSWALVFDKKLAPPKITMLDDPLDSISITSQYLFGTIENLTKEQLQKIKELLKEQRNWVEAYTDSRADYFLSLGICQAVVTQSSYVYRAMLENNNLEFIIPKEGGFIVIDSLVIPKFSDKDDAVYKFINFLYKEKELRLFVEKFGYLPVIKNILYSTNLDYLGGISKLLSPEQFSKYKFFKRTIPLEVVSQMWIEVKA